MKSYTPLAEPFRITFEKDGLVHEAEVTYAKSLSSCSNFFDVKLITPKLMEPFCLKEKPVHHEASDSMVWVDEYEKQSILYQMIGNEIAGHLKHQLGVFLLDQPVEHKDDQEENNVQD